jgi:hypothetical protein
MNLCRRVFDNVTTENIRERLKLPQKNTHLLRLGPLLCPGHSFIRFRCAHADLVRVRADSTIFAVSAPSDLPRLRDLGAEIPVEGVVAVAAKKTKTKQSRSEVGKQK